MTKERYIFIDRAVKLVLEDKAFTVKDVAAEIITVLNAVSY